MKALMRLREAAEEASVSVETLRQAIKATDPYSFPPPLKAKRIGKSDRKPEYRVKDVDLQAWIDSLPDA